MPILSTVEITMKDDAAEARFLQAFTSAAGAAAGAPGLIELKAYKRVGAERTYLASVLWESEAHLEAWVSGPQEQANIKLGKEQLLQSALVRRFAQQGPDTAWARE